MAFCNPAKKKITNVSTNSKLKLPKTKKRKLETKTGESFLNKPKNPEEPHKKFAFYALKCKRPMKSWNPPLKMDTNKPAKKCDLKDCDKENSTAHISNQATTKLGGKESDKENSTGHIPNQAAKMYNPEESNKENITVHIPNQATTKLDVKESDKENSTAHIPNQVARIYTPEESDKENFTAHIPNQVTTKLDVEESDEENSIAHIPNQAARIYTPEESDKENYTAHIPSQATTKLDVKKSDKENATAHIPNQAARIYNPEVSDKENSTTHIPSQAAMKYDLEEFKKENSTAQIPNQAARLYNPEESDKENSTTHIPSQAAMKYDLEEFNKENSTAQIPSPVAKNYDPEESIKENSTHISSQTAMQYDPEEFSKEISTAHTPSKVAKKYDPEESIKENSTEHTPSHVAKKYDVEKSNKENSIVQIPNNAINITRGIKCPDETETNAKSSFHISEHLLDPRMSTLEDNLTANKRLLPSLKSIICDANDLNSLERRDTISEIFSSVQNTKNATKAFVMELNVNELKKNSQETYKENTNDQIFNLKSIYNHGEHENDELTATTNTEKVTRQSECEINTEIENSLPRSSSVEKLTKQESLFFRDISGQSYERTDDFKTQFQDRQLKCTDFEENLVDTFNSKVLSCDSVSMQRVETITRTDEKVIEDGSNAIEELSSDDELDNIISKTIEKYMDKEKLEKKLKKKMSMIELEDSSQETVILSPEKLEQKLKKKMPTIETDNLSQETVILSPEKLEQKLKKKMPTIETDNLSQETVILLPEKLNNSKPLSNKGNCTNNFDTEKVNSNRKNESASHYCEKKSSYDDSDSPLKATQFAQSNSSQYRNNTVEHLQSSLAIRESNSEKALFSFENDLKCNENVPVVLEPPKCFRSKFLENILNYTELQNENGTRTENFTSDLKSKAEPDFFFDRKPNENASCSQINFIPAGSSTQKKNEMVHNFSLETPTRNTVTKYLKYPAIEDINKNRVSTTSNDVKTVPMKDIVNNLHDKKYENENCLEEDRYISEFYKDSETDLFLNLDENYYFQTIPQSTASEIFWRNSCDRENQAHKSEEKLDENQINLNKSNHNDSYLNLGRIALDPLKTLQKNLELLRSKQAKNNDQDLEIQETAYQQLISNSNNNKESDKYRDDIEYNSTDTTNMNMGLANDRDIKKMSNTGSTTKEKAYGRQLVTECHSKSDVKTAERNSFAQTITKSINDSKKLDPTQQTQFLSASNTPTELQYSHFSQKNTNKAGVLKENVFRTFSDLYENKHLIKDNYNAAVKEDKESIANYQQSPEKIAAFPFHTTFKNGNQYQLSTNQNMASMYNKQILDDSHDKSRVDPQEPNWTSNNFSVEGNENRNIDPDPIRKDYYRCAEPSNLQLPIQHSLFPQHVELLSKNNFPTRFNLISSSHTLEYPTFGELSLRTKGDAQQNQEKIKERLNYLQKVINESRKERETKTESIRNSVSEINILVNNLIDSINVKAKH